jgi:hypothetical protein
MSSKSLGHYKIYSKLKESIDFENATSIPLKINIRSVLEVEGLELGIMVEQFTDDNIGVFKEGTILYNEFDPKTYYNLGFDINESTNQTKKTNYKTLSKVLGIVVKSTLNWIKSKNPQVITIIPGGSNQKEFNSKLSIYASILENNKSYLDNIGYSWDYYQFTTGKGLYIRKIKK